VTGYRSREMDPEATPRPVARPTANTRQQPAFPAFNLPAEPFGAGITEVAKPRSAAGPVLLTILLLGGAGGAGYWKLQQDFQAALRARDAVLLETQEAKSRAVEAAARAEQQAKVAVAAAEDRLKAIASEKARLESAAAAAASIAPAASAVADTKAAAKPEAKAKHAAAKHPAAKPAATKVAVADKKPAAAEARPDKPEKKDAPAAMPKVAHKKKYSDDPLAGLKM
jgi:hypothetical protein